MRHSLPKKLKATGEDQAATWNNIKIVINRGFIPLVLRFWKRLVKAKYKAEWVESFSAMKEHYLEMDSSFRCKQQFQSRQHIPGLWSLKEQKSVRQALCSPVSLWRRLAGSSTQTGNTRNAFPQAGSCRAVEMRIRVRGGRDTSTLQCRASERKPPGKEAQKSTEGPICISGSGPIFVFIVWNSMGQAKNLQGKNSDQGPVSSTTSKILTEVGGVQEPNNSGALEWRTLWTPRECHASGNGVLQTWHRGYSGPALTKF